MFPTVNTISGLVERLEQCGQQTGLKLSRNTAANEIALRSDIFEVLVIMDAAAAIKDVRIVHNTDSEVRKINLNFSLHFNMLNYFNHFNILCRRKKYFHVKY